jgi:3alpha(or 20beta)-hydroxysteroid dehydrogenase
MTIITVISIFLDMEAQGGSAPAGRLAGKTALITGSARGVGASIATAFAAAGAAVMVTDILDELGVRTAREISGLDLGPTLYQHLDVTDEADWAAAMARCEDELGPVDIFVSNAFSYGADNSTQFVDMSLPQWQRGIDVNLTGPFLGTRAVLPRMIERGAGSIIAIASVSGTIQAFPKNPDYQAAKAGTAALMRNVCVAYGQAGVRANTMLLSATKSPILPLRWAEQFMGGWPTPRPAEPEEVAAVALFLASDDSSYINGTSIPVDGGSVLPIAPPTIKLPAEMGELVDESGAMRGHD